MDTMLTMLKVDLGIKGTAYDERLTQYLTYSRQEIESKNVALSITDIQDQQLIVMYASWLWRRRNSGEGMSRMLRYTLNNRLIGRGRGEINNGQCN